MHAKLGSTWNIQHFYKQVVNIFMEDTHLASSRYISFGRFYDVSGLYSAYLQDGDPLIFGFGASPDNQNVPSP